MSDARMQESTPVMLLDFNDAPDQMAPAPAIDREAEKERLRAELLARLPAVLQSIFPAGKARSGKFHIGDVHGNPGDSLEVVLDGPKAGLWTDRATGEGGEIFALLAANRGIDDEAGFPQVLAFAAELAGRAPLVPPPKPARTAPIDELGPATAQWRYLDANGQLLAVVYRYDLADGRKEFRPWDARQRKMAAPDPRPLYNQPGIAAANTVVLVEGEKCAEALIQHGVVATTAMHGASAPVDKTDWSPLKAKHVLIWPDHDEPGQTYAKNAAKAAVAAGALSVVILEPPKHKPGGWDAADALAEGFDCDNFIRHSPRTVIKAISAPLPVYTLGSMLDDDSPLPEDLIGPRVLTPAGLLVFGGAPKVGKSDFLLSWLAHMAAGADFLGMRPSRPLRVFYLQAEVQYDYLRERLRAIQLPASRLMVARRNLVVTGQLRLVLDESGLQQVIPAIAQAFGGEAVDLIAIDPIRNVFDSDDEGSENDNAAMLHFLSQRVERLRDALNPQAGLILVHHTRKLPKKQFEEDPFQALAGASSLRGYYTTGMLLYRPEEGETPRQLIFELRNGPAIATKLVDKDGPYWQEQNAHGVRIVRQQYGDKLDAERRRKRDVIVEKVYEEAQEGRVYTPTQFAEAFENHAGLGGRSTLTERLNVLATQGYLRYFRDARNYGLPPLQRSKYGYLCVEGMVLRDPKGSPDPVTGELRPLLRPVLPTHYKCPQSGRTRAVENPAVWIYLDDENELNEDQ